VGLTNQYLDEDFNIQSNAIYRAFITTLNKDESIEYLYPELN